MTDRDTITLPREVALHLEAMLICFSVAQSPRDQRQVHEAIAALRAALRTALAAEQPKPEPVAWLYKGEPWFDGDCWHDNHQVTTSKQVAKFKDKNAQPLYTAPPATHPGYVIGSHWLETAYSRICAGEAEADVLRDIGLVREEAFLTGVAHLKAENEALRRDAERYKWLKAKVEDYDGHACFPEVSYPAPIPDRSPFDAIDAAIDAAMKEGT